MARRCITLGCIVMYCTVFLYATSTARLELKLAALEDEVSDLRNKVANPVAFTMALNMTFAPNSTETIPYNIVLLNHGNAYDTNNH